MRIKSLFISALAGLALLASCDEPNTDLGAPALTLVESEITIPQEGGEAVVTLTSTRDWVATSDAEWLVVSPESGSANAEAQTATVTALENTGMDREATVTFTIGMVNRYLTVKQPGLGGSESDYIVYYNDFDKEKAEKEEDAWKTYLDEFDGWKNAVGTGAADCGFMANGMTARSNSSNGSGGKHSVYEGSGMNYLWFAKNNYFAITNMTLQSGKSNYTLSFGTERYEYEAEDNTFRFDEFKVYISADAEKWVEVTYTFPGEVQNGKWDLASTTFTVPEGTSKLSVYFTASVASAYAIDDLKLVVSDAEGTQIDFSTGIELDGSVDNGGNEGDGGNEDDGENPNPPSSYPTEKPTPTPITIAEFLTKPVNYTDWYQLTGKITEIEPSKYGNIFIEDETGKVYIYGITSQWIGAKNDQSFNNIANLSVGDTITIGTLRQEYNNSPQGGGNWCAAWYISHVDGEAQVDESDETIVISDVITALGLTESYELPQGEAIQLNENISITYTKNNSSNSNFHFGDMGLRWYKNDVLKFTSKKSIAKLEFDTYGGKEGPLTADKGSMDSSGVVWTGDASEITFTASSQIRVSKIKVTYVK